MQIQKLESLEQDIFPKMIGNELTKRLITIQLFTEPLQEERFHTLVVGTVATGKSTLLGLEVNKILPNSSYASKRITAIGLEEKIIACDGGMVIGDEFDKWSPYVRDQLLESMQSGEHTIDKFHYHARHQARYSALIFCNPRNYVMVEDMPIHSQVSFSLPLLSRFHFIAPVYPVDDVFYPDIAVAMARRNVEGDEERRRKITEYIVRVKQAFPVVEVSDSIAKEIGNQIRELRYRSPMKNIINPRLIEGVLSAVRARARMEHKQNATMEDWASVRQIVEKIYL